MFMTIVMHSLHSHATFTLRLQGAETGSIKFECIELQVSLTDTDTFENFEDSLKMSV